MNKEDWLEYFEAINERQPTAEEISQALRNGDFQDYQVRDIPHAQEKVQEIYDPIEEDHMERQPIPESKNNYYQEASQPISSPPSSQSNSMANVDNLKVGGKNYLAWFLDNLKNPQARAKDSQFIFGLISLLASGLFFAWAIVNYFNRILMSVANMTFDGKSLESLFPDGYARVKNIIASQFGFGKIFYLAIIISVIYFISIFIPYVINNMSNKKGDFKDEMGRMMSFTPLLLIINLLAFLSTFLVNNRLDVSVDIYDKVFSIFTEFTSNAFQAITDTIDLLKEIPGLASIKSVFIYLLILAILSLLVIFVNIIKNINGSVGLANAFYMTIAAIIVLSLIIFFADKMIVKAIIDSFVAMKSIVS